MQTVSLTYNMHNYSFVIAKCSMYILAVKSDESTANLYAA